MSCASCCEGSICDVLGDVDLVIVGAGIFGLTSAATYHQVHPEASILIVDNSPGIGGPWAAHRTFPGLKTNNLVGMYEHPDFPLTERFGVNKGEHIPAEKMLDYLEAFVEESDIKQFLRLNSKASLLEQRENGWTLHVDSVKTTAHFQVNAKRVIIAIGTTNEPKIMTDTSAKSLTIPFIHSVDFPARYPDIVKPSRHTLVIGAGKSAWDVAYACTTQPDATATILINPAGKGPSWMTPTHVTPFRIWLEKLVFTRFFGFMSPCPWAKTTGLEGWLRSILHGTRVGRRVVAAFWKVLGDDAIALTRLNEHPETKKLVPWRGAFEVSTCLGIHNYPTDFYELVRQGRIKIVIDSVEKFSGSNEAVLRDSRETLKFDAIVCATGWTVGHSLTYGLESVEELGLPRNTLNEDKPPHDAALITQSEADLINRFPFLRDRDTSRTQHPDPTQRYTQNSNTHQQPYRLYRFMVPPAKLPSRNIVFAGAIFCLGTFPLAYIQSLWIVAYFDGRLKLPNVEEARKEAYTNSQYCILRSAMGYGRSAPDIVFDSLPHFDVLLRDLGFEGRRKGAGLGELWRSYGPEDYRGLLDEALERWGREGKKGV